MKKVSQQEFRDWYNNLYNSGAIYLWGANGETITKELTDKLYKSFGSITYTKDYYDNKYREGKGKIGADCSGSIYKLSGIDRTAKGYFNACKSTGPIASIPRGLVCLVFNKNLTHVGAYLGNGITIEMRSSRMNVYKENLKTNRWYYYGIPDFVDYDTIDTSVNETESNVIVKDYQAWLNNLLSLSIQVDGDYGPTTKKTTVKALQTIYNKYYGANISVDGNYGQKTKAACPSWGVMKNNQEGFSLITYIIHIYLYVNKYDVKNIINGSKVSTEYSENTIDLVKEYQLMNKGLVCDGKAGSATLYNMFK